MFGGANNNASTPASGTSGGLFGGSGPTTNVSASSTSNPLFGGVFNLPKPTESSSAPSIGNPSSTGSGLFGGGLFGKKPDETAPAAASTASAAPSPFGSFSLGGTTKDVGPTTGGLFGALGANKDKPTEKKDPPIAPPALNLFGAPKDTSTDKKEASAVPATFNLFGGAKDSSAEKKDGPTEKPTDSAASSIQAQAPAAATPSATAVAVPPPSMLRGKTIEEIVNRWSSDLDSHVREFNTFSGEVAVWDRALIENGNNLAALYSHVIAAEREQNDIDQSLDHIEQQQKDLLMTLDAYEKSAEEILGGQGGSIRALDTGPADTERDKNYMLATDLHTHLDDLSGSLTQMIESVNGLSLSSGSADSSTKAQGEDPMAQISSILSSHLESLQWIDGTAREVEKKITEVEKRVNLGSGFTKSRTFDLNR